ncbi:HNH endonuclease [Nocardia vulneris]|uniref:HNH endonuclease n=1 Tax=Nocardia vulneris TaxID=1141657 RepID=UPI0009E39038|nr:HNH endonuclease [Nocardia vulneris]
MTEPKGDCRIWLRTINKGYPQYNYRVGKTYVTLYIHRLVLEAKLGRPLGSMRAHHICGNSACVNPDHLQSVTDRDNIAEMLQRRTYLDRIRELEAALVELEPGHPLLSVVRVA